jgi:hypothetical protein
MKQTLKSIEEMVLERPVVDNAEVFDALWEITGSLRKKLDARFELQADPGTSDFQPYQAVQGEARGYLAGLAGPEIDWMVHSWIGTPHTSFTNMHLTVHLGPQVDVPHFGFALGTAPDIFVYMDYVPRKDLAIELDYLDSYYGPVNESFLKIRADKRFSPFVSQDLYMRQTQSRTSHCYLVPVSDETLEIISNLGHEMLDRWLSFVDAAPPVPAENRSALAARDLHLRRSISERDPANAIGARLFGEAMTNRLVRGLWGGDRQLPRAINWEQSQAP